MKFNKCVVIGQNLNHKEFHLKAVQLIDKTKIDAKIDNEGVVKLTYWSDSSFDQKIKVMIRIF